MKFLLSRNRRNHGEVGSHSSLLGNPEELDEDEEIYGDDDKPSFDLSIYKKDDVDCDAPALEPASPASTCSTKTKSHRSASSTVKPIEHKKKTNDKDENKLSNSPRSPDQDTNELIANTLYNNHNRGVSEGDDLSYDVLPLSLWSELKHDQDISPATSPQKSADELADPQGGVTTRTTSTESNAINNNHGMDTTAGDFTFPTNFANTQTSNFVFDGEFTDRIVISEIPQPSHRDYQSDVVEGLITDANGDSWIVFIPRPIDFNDELTWFSETSECQIQPLNKTLSSLTSDSQESHRRRQRHLERERNQHREKTDNNTPQWTASAVLDILRDTICSIGVRNNINELLKK